LRPQFAAGTLRGIPLMERCMSPTRPHADTTGPAPRRRRRIVLLLVVFAVLAVAWTSPVVLLSPDAEGRALIAAGVPRSEFPALVADGGNAYAADTLAHDWADMCDRQPETDRASGGWAQQALSALQRFNPFATDVDCDSVRMIALRTESLRDDGDDDTCADDGEEDDRPDAPAAVAASYRQHAPGTRRRSRHSSRT
jgi:hypothetical protein